ncbi:MAG: ABC transporter permease [Christensenellales bacterium]|jgi:ribose transport system permease protein
MEETKLQKETFKDKLKASNYIVFIVLLVLSAFLGILSPVFFSGDNIMNILLQASINGVIAVGLTMVIITGGIDLSVGSVVAVAGIFMGLVKNVLGPENPLSGILGILGALVIGALLGSINGVMITKGKLPPFIATLGMMTIGRGLALVMSDGRPIGDIPPLIRFIGGEKILGVYTPIIIMVIVYVVAYWLLKYTRQGRNTYATGGNMEAAKLSGINVNRTIVNTYVLSGICSGIAAVMLVGRLNSAAPTAGLEYEMNAIAASVIGGTSMSGGEGSILGTLIGALLISVLRNGLNILGVSSYWQQIAIGLVIIFAVLSDTLKHRNQ